ncbi:hypothetical protein [Motilimonas sp. E26]|uniref:hypothetical protein n=1 Tax=Motilimonas sp. E26 TaxID=2865674 RepID=UPI001E29FA1F|nr:hypothetical protein [Motilimonas sp. E26]MCE0559404.1 hypothetical protein [Motilimonas sp. E26]
MARNELYESIISKKLELDCLGMQLKQCCDNSPLIIDGTGFIKQSSDGHISFKLLYDGKSDESIFNKLQYLHSLPAGSLLPTEHFFDLTAEDFHGYQWKASKIHIDPDIHVSNNTAVIKGKIENLILEETSNAEKTPFCRVMVEGDYRLPWNKFRDQSGGGSRLSEIELKVDDIDINLFNDSNTLNISFSSSGLVNIEKYREYFIQALSILLGKQPSILYEIDRVNGLTKTKVYSNRHYVDGKLESPIKIWMPYDTESFSEFINSYISHAIEHDGLDTLFGYWHKIYLVSNSTVQASALACGVSIEGLVNKYFNQLFPIPDSEMEPLKDAMTTLKDLDIDQVVKDKLKSSLGNFKTKSPKRVLFELCESIEINSDLVKTWSKLRNKSAHADDLDMDQQQFEEYFLQYRSCLYLFYRLLFQIIEYKGSCIDYTVSGCPEIPAGKNA